MAATRKRQTAADEEADHDLHVKNIDAVKTHRRAIGREQGQGRSGPPKPMAKPLPMAAVVLPSESSRSVMARTSGPRPDISEMPPAFVGDRAVSVDRHGHSNGGQHTNTGDTDAVKTGEAEAGINSDTDNDNREHHRLHAYSETADNIGCGTRQRGMSNVTDRLGRRVILG